MASPFQKKGLRFPRSKLPPQQPPQDDNVLNLNVFSALRGWYVGARKALAAAVPRTAGTT